MRKLSVRNVDFKRSHARRAPTVEVGERLSNHTL